MPSIKMSVAGMVQAIKKGEITSEDLVKSYINEIKKKKKMWEHGNFLMKILQLDKQKN